MSNRVEERIKLEMQGWKKWNGGLYPNETVDVIFRNGTTTENIDSEFLDWGVDQHDYDIVWWRFSEQEKCFRDEIPELMGKTFPEKEVDLKETSMNDAVNPKHYKDIVPGYEYFDVMDYMLEDWSGSQAHALGNALKYLMRLGKKDDIPQEIGKAIWYLERLKKDVEEKGKL